MFDIDKTIDAFRRGAIDIDCSRIVLTQRKEDGECYEGPGYIRQSDGGSLIFKIYVGLHNTEAKKHAQAMFKEGAGKLFGDEAFFDLEAITWDGTRWTAKQILPDTKIFCAPALVTGVMQSMIARLDNTLADHKLRLHFFEAYDIPCSLMSKTEDHRFIRHVRDRDEFEACGAKFEVQKLEDVDDTIVELTSNSAFPLAFDLRVQEALQYLVAKPAFWRARVQDHEKELHLELSSPRRKPTKTQFQPPISSSDIRHFWEDGWKLFTAYLTYITERTPVADGAIVRRWNSVAYHLNNACEATANSTDASAVGISVAVEALASLISITVSKDDDKKAQELERYQKIALEWLSEQKDLSESIVKRAEGQIRAMKNKNVKSTLHTLANMGRVEKSYIKAWDDLRQRHVHPTLDELGQPNPMDMQKLLDNIHKVEVLLRQITFHLIDYKGHYTDYGVHGGLTFPSKQYPLNVDTQPYVV